MKKTTFCGSAKKGEREEKEQTRKNKMTGSSTFLQQLKKDQRPFVLLYDSAVKYHFSQSRLS